MPRESCHVNRKYRCHPPLRRGKKCPCELSRWNLLVQRLIANPGRFPHPIDRRRNTALAQASRLARDIYGNEHLEVYV